MGRNNQNKTQAAAETAADDQNTAPAETVADAVPQEGASNVAPEQVAQDEAPAEEAAPAAEAAASDQELPAGDADAAPVDAVADAEPATDENASDAETGEAGAEGPDEGVVTEMLPELTNLVGHVADKAEAAAGTDAHFTLHTLEVALGDVKQRIPAAIAALGDAHPLLTKILQTLLKLL